MIKDLLFSNSWTLPLFWWWKVCSNFHQAVNQNEFLAINCPARIIRDLDPLEITYTRAFCLLIFFFTLRQVQYKLLSRWYASIIFHDASPTLLCYLVSFTSANFLFNFSPPLFIHFFPSSAAFLYLFLLFCFIIFLFNLLYLLFLLLVLLFIFLAVFLLFLLIYSHFLFLCNSSIELDMENFVLTDWIIIQLTTGHDINS